MTSTRNFRDNITNNTVSLDTAPLGSENINNQVLANQIGTLTLLPGVSVNIAGNKVILTNNTGHSVTLSIPMINFDNAALLGLDVEHQ